MVFTASLRDLLESDRIEYVNCGRSRPSADHHAAQLRAIGERLTFQTTEPGLRLRMLATWEDTLIPNMPVEVLEYVSYEPAHVDACGVHIEQGYKFLNKGLTGEETLLADGSQWANRHCKVERFTAVRQPKDMMLTQVLYRMPE